MATSAGEADTVVADTVGGDLPNPVVDGELEQQTNTDFLARDDDFPPSKSVKKEEPETPGKEEKKDWMENLKSTLMVSGVVIAIIGAIFAVAKKIKEA